MGLQRYREMEIRTASPVMLVAKMYEGVIRQVRAARDHHSAGRLADRGDAISRALAIVGELRQGLDFERGGEIAQNLENLYVFALERLVEANARGRGGALDEVLGVLTPLHEAWAELARRPLESAATPAG